MKTTLNSLRACLKILKGAAPRDFARGQGGEAGASPQRAVTAEPTQATVARPAARRVFAEKAGWLRCSSVEDPQGTWASQALQVGFPRINHALSRIAVTFVAPRHPAFSTKTAPFIIFRQALTLAEVVALLLSLAGTRGVCAAETATNDPPLPFPLIERFENFQIKDGMPTHKVHCVLRASDGKLWVGTYSGALIREDGRFQHIGVEDGLSHKMVMCLVEDQRTGDMWIGTMRGLNRYSAGRITSYLQTDSGLPNNVIYGLDIVDGTLWVATAAGLGALNLKTGQWSIYDQSNTTMHEPWVYSVKGEKGRLFVGVWGGGILERDLATGTFKEHRDPDRDFHFDLVPDDGPVNDITSWIALEDGILWQSTYFGMSRYDGSRWRTWQENKSPLVSNFINFIWAHNRVAWVGTDRGMSVTDGDTWVNYRTNQKGEGLLEITRPGQPVETRTMSTRLPNDFVLGIWADDQEAWLATSDGLSHAIFSSPQKPPKIADAK